MKNRLWNEFPKNPTQTRYLRFLQGPRGELKSSFTDAMERFHKIMESRETVYDKYMGPLE